MRSLLAGLLPLVVLIAACSREKTREAPVTRSLAVPAASSPAATATPWGVNAASLRGRNGQRFELACSGSPVIGTVWGTDLYTDDSSICSAAVHAGLIDQSGGTFTIEIRPGEAGYAGSERHGIVSRDYNSWSGSFVFVGKDGKPIEPTAGEGRGSPRGTDYPVRRRSRDDRDSRRTAVLRGERAEWRGVLGLWAVGRQLRVRQDELRSFAAR